ncbi:MAG TPA: hypothetical protein VFK13_09395 [Gemmatimonadaceae bacterium]|nr:hypothetical protein [Gemmatimonadaceae bacterium]
MPTPTPTPPTPELRIEFAKRADGAAVLRCMRPDGTATWQRHDGRQAMFFPFHDLSHFAVETTLGFRGGFYGLIASGWEIADTDGKGSRGPIPAEAVLVEHVVGMLDRERIGGADVMTAAELNAQLRQLEQEGRLECTRTFTDEELRAVRARTDALHAQWAALAPGGTMALSFDRGA